MEDVAASKRPSPKPDASQVRETLRRNIIKSFLTDNKDKRQAIVALRRKNSNQQGDEETTIEGRCDLIKEFIQSQYEKVAIEDFLNWDGFLESKDYEELFLDIEQAIQDEEDGQTNTPRCDCDDMVVEGGEDEQLLEAYGVIDEMRYWDDEQSNESFGNDNHACMDDVIICPICWNDTMMDDPHQRGVIRCSCGAVVSLLYNYLGRSVDKSEFKVMLSSLYDRHFEYCQQYCTYHDIHNTPENSMRCWINDSGEMTATCNTCGYRERVL